jgi:uncharacterized protein (TIRG00374 family)
MKAKVSIIAGLAVSAGLLFLAFRNIDFGKLTVIYSSVNLWYLIPFAGVTLVEMAFRGLRWKLLLDPARPVRFWDAFRLETAGLALNNVLPMRLGEVMRGAFGAGLLKIPVMTVLATILVERALDAIVLVLLAVLAARFGGITGGMLGYGGYFWALFGCIVAALLMLVFLDEIISHHLFSGFFKRFPRLTKGLEHLALGVRAFHSPVNAAAVLALAVFQWLLDALNFYIIAAAFGLGSVLTIFKCVVLLLSVAAAASIPGVPGGFGNFEFAITKVAGAWGVNGEVAFAYATFLHIVSYVFVTVVGLVFVYQMGQSVGKVWAQFSGKKESGIKGPGANMTP